MRHTAAVLGAVLLLSARCAGQPGFTGDLTQHPDRGTIALVGDTQRTGLWELLAGREQNDQARTEVMGRIAASDPGLLIILGDLVENGSDPDAWRTFDELTAPVRLRGIPVYPVRGNHEYHGSITQGAASYFSRFPYLAGRSWLAIGYRNVAFILLNSNFTELSPAEIERQDAWYRRTLDSCQADPKVAAIVVCCHHPPFTNSSVVPDDPLVQHHFADPYLQTPKATLFFSGHVHAYERFRIAGKQFLVSGGGGGPRQRLVTELGRRRHPPEQSSARRWGFHYCEIALEPRQLRVRVQMLDVRTNRWSTPDEFVVPFIGGAAWNSP